jgi:hypothetical protein
MRKLLFVTMLAILVAGCDAIRFAPTETQKENAWSHLQVTRATAQEAKAANCAGNVCSLASLGAKQAEAFAADYGMPKELPQGETPDQLLAEANWQRADFALQDSQSRPDPWALADGVLEFGAGLAGLFGGVYGTRLVRFVSDARQKARALKEVVEGNELFKKRNPDAASDFKDAHAAQSQDTRQLVASLK